MKNIGTKTDKSLPLSEEELFTLKKSTILFVEDSDAIIGSVLPVFLKMFKIVLLARNEAEAIQIYNESKDSIDIVLTELASINLNGVILIETIRVKNQDFTTPIIVYTEEKELTNILPLLKLKINDFLIRPTQLGTLHRLLAREINYSFLQNVVQRNYEIYKDIIDETNIISKSDSEGLITFVNEKFCEVSGYSEEELIGSSHSLLRHEDMPSEVFKKMWETISNGEIWKGNVKNKSKTGEIYWVRAFILPILNKEGEIVEYIATRHLITEDVERERKMKSFIISSRSEHATAIKSVKVSAIENAKMSSSEQIKKQQGKIDQLQNELALLKQKHGRGVNQIEHMEATLKISVDKNIKTMESAKDRAQEQHTARKKVEKELENLKQNYASLIAKSEEDTEHMRKIANDLDHYKNEIRKKNEVIELMNKE